MRKPAFAYAKTKAQSLRTAKLIRAFVFAIRIIQFLYYPNPKFQALSNLVWLYSPVCVGPGRKPGRLVFSERGSNVDSFVGAIDYRKQHGGADALSPGGSVIPVHPDVTFKRLPFYDIMGELLKPTSLGKVDSFRMIKYGKPK